MSMKKTNYNLQLSQVPFNFKRNIIITLKEFEQSKNCILRYLQIILQINKLYTKKL